MSDLAVDAARAEISGPDEAIRVLLAGDEPVEVEPPLLADGIRAARAPTARCRGNPQRDELRSLGLAGDPHAHDQALLTAPRDSEEADGPDAFGIGGQARLPRRVRHGRLVRQGRGERVGRVGERREPEPSGHLDVAHVGLADRDRQGLPPGRPY